MLLPAAGHAVGTAFPARHLPPGPWLPDPPGLRLPGRLVARVDALQRRPRRLLRDRGPRSPDLVPDDLAGLRREPAGAAALGLLRPARRGDGHGEHLPGAPRPAGPELQAGLRRLAMQPDRHGAGPAGHDALGDPRPGHALCLRLRDCYLEALVQPAGGRGERDRSQAEDHPGGHVGVPGALLLLG